MDTVICKEVIVSTLARRGAGTPGSPIRVITQVFEKDGTLIAENDSMTLSEEDINDFWAYCESNDFKPCAESLAKWRTNNLTNRL